MRKRSPTQLGSMRRAQILNLAYHPKLRQQPYEQALDLDLKLAKRFQGRPVHYLMASSRMVYGLGYSGPLRETLTPRPENWYGKAKLETELRLQDLLGDRLTILRLSNIFGPDEALGHRNSFFGLALRKLAAEDRIVFDMSPFVQRDFLPVEELSRMLVAVAAAPASGVFNIASGARPLHAAALRNGLIEGYGRGELHVINRREFDPFSVDIDKSSSVWDFCKLDPQQIRSVCLAAGCSLKRRGAETCATPSLAPAR